MARMEKVGAVAAVQPSFVPSDAAVVVKRLRLELVGVDNAMLVLLFGQHTTCLSYL